MKMIYETPQMEYELLTKEDVMAASPLSPDATQDKDNTYVNNYSLFGYSAE